MKKELNQDIETRDKMIYGKYRPNKYKFGNICYFKEMPLKVLSWLFEQNYIDPNCSKGKAPTSEQILDFLSYYPEYSAHGFTVNIDDENYGVYIEGVEKGETSSSVEEFKDFMSLFSACDSFNEKTMYCWFE